MSGSLRGCLQVGDAHRLARPEGLGMGTSSCSRSLCLPRQGQSARCGSALCWPCWASTGCSLALGGLPGPGLKQESQPDWQGPGETESSFPFYKGEHGGPEK